MKHLVKHLMTKEVQAVRASDDLSVLYELMNDYHIRHIPVVDRHGSVLGLVSHRDLVKAVLYGQETLPLTSLYQMLRATKVEEIMVKGIETIAPTAPLGEAGATMLENKYGCLPVTENGRLVGILTEADFVRYVVAEE